MSSAEKESENMIRNLEEKTSKSLDAWIGIARKSGSEKHGDT